MWGGGTDSPNTKSQQEGSSFHCTEAVGLCTYGKDDRSAIVGCMAEMVTMATSIPACLGVPQNRAHCSPKISIV